MRLKIESVLRYAIFIMGFTALATQIVLLREAMNIFNGNELVIGILLSNWMLLTGAGAYLGRYAGKPRATMQVIIITQLFLSFLPMVTMAGMYFLSSGIIHAGIMFSPLQVWLLTFILLIPFCLLSGALFTLFSAATTHKTDQFSIGKVYGIEALGSIIGGLIFSIFLIGLLDSFESFYILLWLNLSAVFALSVATRKRWVTFSALLLGVSGILGAWFLDADMWITRLQYPGQEIIYHRETPYGKIVVSESNGQRNFYENGSLYFSSDQVERNEEIVHFAMAQHERPELVLLISGGISGTAREITKYQGVLVDYLEINPAWIETGKLYADAISHTRVNPVSMDARKFIKQSVKKYDVVIIDLPAPVTAQLNRYFTLEFFREVKSVMQADGILSIHLPSSVNYMSKELIQSHSMLFSTLSNVFREVIIFNGVFDYFIAADSELQYDILGRLLRMNVENIYVNPYYYVPELAQMRGLQIKGSLDPAAGINRDFKPKSYVLQLNYWISHFSKNIWILPLLILILCVSALFFSNNTNKALFISGFTGASLEFILIICFQVMYGYVYLMTGLLITVFMSGLAAGTLLLPKWLSPAKGRYFTIQLCIAALAIGTPLVLLYLSSLKTYDGLTIAVINLFSFLTGTLIGFQFNQAAFLQQSPVLKAASSTYAIDLIGSTAGSLATALILVPLLGIIESCMIIAGLNILISFVIPGKKIKA